MRRTRRGCSPASATARPRGSVGMRGRGRRGSTVRAAARATLAIPLWSSFSYCARVQEGALRGVVTPKHVLTKFVELRRDDGLADLVDESNHEALVVNRAQHRGQHLLRLD